MNQARCVPDRWRRAFTLLTLAAALTIAACDGDVELNPVVPSPTPTPIGPRTLLISGMLSAAQGSCLEATVLYDGRELRGSRASCPGPDGCADLTLAARTATASGRHTISFQVVRQSSRRVSYLARGRVRVTRAGFAGGQDMYLQPVRATLAAGESVDFVVEFRD